MSETRDSLEETRHPHGGVLVAGCGACVEMVRHDQVEAEVAGAPLRKVTVKFTVPEPYGIRKINCTAELSLRIPSGWSEGRWENWHFDAITDAMVMALPSEIPMEYTDAALERLEEMGYDVGAVIPESKTEPVPATPSLFEVGA